MVKNKKLNKHQSDNEESRSEFYSDVMLLSDLVSKHCTSLPLIVCTVSGHYGNNILEDMSANQILFVRRVQSEQRLMMRRKDGKFLSFPLDFPTLFSLLDSKNKMTRQADVKELMVRSLNVDEQRVKLAANASFNVAGVNVTSEKLGVMEVFRRFKEYYLVGHRIVHADVTDHVEPKPLAIPAYLNLKVRILYGQEGVSFADWSKQLSSFTNQLASSANAKPEEMNYVCIYDNNDLSIHPSLMTVFRPKKSLKPTSSDNYAAENAISNGKNDVESNVKVEHNASNRPHRNGVERESLSKIEMSKEKKGGKAEVGKLKSYGGGNEVEKELSARGGSKTLEKVLSGQEPREEEVVKKKRLLMAEIRSRSGSHDDNDIQSEREMLKRGEAVEDDAVDAGVEKGKKTIWKEYSDEEDGERIIYQQYDGESFGNRKDSVDENNNRVGTSAHKEACDNIELQALSSRENKETQRLQNTKKPPQHPQHRFQFPPRLLKSPNEEKAASKRSEEGGGNRRSEEGGGNRRSEEGGGNRRIEEEGNRRSEEGGNRSGEEGGNRKKEEKSSKVVAASGELLFNGRRLQSINNNNNNNNNKNDYIHDNEYYKTENNYDNQYYNNANDYDDNNRNSYYYYDNNTSNNYYNNKPNDTTGTRARMEKDDRATNEVFHEAGLFHSDTYHRDHYSSNIGHHTTLYNGFSEREPPRNFLSDEGYSRQAHRSAESSPSRRQLVINDTQPSAFARVTYVPKNRSQSYDREYARELSPGSLQKTEEEELAPKHFLYKQNRLSALSGAYRDHEEGVYEGVQRRSGSSIMLPQHSKPLESPKPKSISYSVTDTIISFDAKQKLKNKKHLHDITYRANNIDSDLEGLADGRGVVTASKYDKHHPSHPLMHSPIGKKLFHKFRKEEENHQKRFENLPDFRQQPPLLHHNHQAPLPHQQPPLHHQQPPLHHQQPPLHHQQPPLHHQQPPLVHPHHHHQQHPSPQQQQQLLLQHQQQPSIKQATLLKQKQVQQRLQDPLRNSPRQNRLSNSHMMQPLFVEIPPSHHRTEATSMHERSNSYGEERFHSSNSYASPFKKWPEKTKASKQEKIFLMDLNGKFASTAAPTRYISRGEESNRRQESRQEGRQESRLEDYQYKSSHQRHSDLNASSTFFKNTALRSKPAHRKLEGSASNGRSSVRDFYAEQLRNRQAKNRGSLDLECLFDKQGHMTLRNHVMHRDVVPHRDDPLAAKSVKRYSDEALHHPASHYNTLRTNQAVTLRTPSSISRNIQHRHSTNNYSNIYRNSSYSNHNNNGSNVYSNDYNNIYNNIYNNDNNIYKNIYNNDNTYKNDNNKYTRGAKNVGNKAYKSNVVVSTSALHEYY